MTLKFYNKQIGDITYKYFDFKVSNCQSYAIFCLKKKVLYC